MQWIQQKITQWVSGSFMLIQRLCFSLELIPWFQILFEFLNDVQFQNMSVVSMCTLIEIHGLSHSAMLTFEFEKSTVNQHRYCCLYPLHNILFVICTLTFGVITQFIYFNPWYPLYCIHCSDCSDCTLYMLSVLHSVLCSIGSAINVVESTLLGIMAVFLPHLYSADLDERV